MSAGATILIALTGRRVGNDGLLLQLLLSEARPGIGLPGLTTVTVTSQEAALDLLARGVPDAVLLKAPFDLDDGLVTLGKVLRAAPAVPVVAVTDSYDPELAGRLLQYGAQDCLLKSELSSAVLGRAIRYAMERQRADVILRRLERYDPLTGVLSGRALLEVLGRLLERRRQQPRSAFAVLVVEVDDLYLIARRHGRPFAEELLIDVARRLERAARPGDLVARLQGDDFVLVLQAIRGPAEMRAVAGRVRALLGAPIHLRQQAVHLAVRSGQALSEEPFDGPHDMLGAAVLQLKCS